MAYPTAHNLLVMFGTTNIGFETDIWQNTIRFSGGSGAPGVASDPEAILDDIEADLSAFWDVIKACHVPGVTFDGFKFNAVGTDGKYLSGETLVRDFATPKAGVSTEGALPPQVSVAVTLETAKARGLAHLGRIYMPPLAVGNLQSNGLLDTGRATSIANAYAGLLTDLGDWPGIDAGDDPGRPYVMSKVRTGAAEPVTGVSVGLRPDVQRRRGNRIADVRGAVAAVS